MGAWVKKITDQSLFTKMFIVMVVSIISVTILTSWVTVQMSQKLFVQTFSITNSKIINQIKTGLDAIHYSNINIAISVAQSGAIRSFLTEGDTDSLTNFKTNFSMSDQMKRIQSGIGAKNIGISVLGMNGRSYVSDVTYWSGSSKELQNSPITQETWKQPGRIMYSFMRAGTWGSNEDRLVATKALLSSESKEGYGSLYMMIRESDFKKIYASFTSQGNDVMILNQNGLIVSSNREDLIGTISEELLSSAKLAQQSQATSQEMTLFNHDVIVLADYLPMYDFYLVNVIDKQMTLGQMLNRKALFMIGAGIVLTAVLVVYFITRRVTRSLRTLVMKMSNITKKNFLNYMAVTGSYETRELSNAYNYMLDELNDYIIQLVETQQEQRKAELAALQQQINPHFLYNTLTSVNILVQQGSKEKATDTIHALISLLQNTISNVKDTISVEQELLNLKHYVFINQVRYGNGIKVDYFVSPDCLKSQVPKLMLQPFIENAFFHAFNKKTTGYIYVIITKEGDTLHCEIVDNGDGMDLAEAKSEQRTSTSARQLFTGIGIRNVHDRILLLYGEKYGVSITSTLGQGTKIAISLPWRT
ncbi:MULTISPECIES: sensor histidine kinase [Paenibacillus]|uniref:Sensor histidine kinase n=1 Tax=Paenibacillus violae TaxID=3077234 RepID=A0ABU3RES5_9BACL|nr:MULTISPECIES: sensor histidine kinase [Paenibacillus]MDU0202591.1 sensor histidine kinase [Paenibacillus sp. PFR10]MEC0268951.1 sensor histidine kinase [Paenibacillus anseongense]